MIIRDGGWTQEAVVRAHDVDHCVLSLLQLNTWGQSQGISKLKSDISWMRAAYQSMVNAFTVQFGDIPIILVMVCVKGVWMRAETLNGKFDPMYGWLRA